jgi:sulfide dehydrogenase cytochrome subunit
MMHSRLINISACAVALTLGAILVQVTDGTELAPELAASCADCHGKDGVSSEDTIPTIAGMSAITIEYALLDFRDGTRVCGEPGTDRAIVMCALAAKLTDAQIKSLAEYFAGQEFRPASQDFDADKAAAGGRIHEKHCEKCHTAGGRESYDDASILAGQWLPYLQTSLARFASGERDAPETMKLRLEQLSEADLEAVAHFYASQQ